MCCPPGNILQRIHFLQHSFKLQLIQHNHLLLRTVLLLILQLQVSLLCPSCFWHQCLCLLDEQVQTTARITRWWFLVWSRRQSILPCLLMSSRPATEGWWGSLALWEDRGGSLRSERIWSDWKSWPQRFSSMSVSQPGAEGSDLWRVYRRKIPSCRGEKNVKPNPTHLI